MADRHYADSEDLSGVVRFSESGLSRQINAEARGPL